MAFQVKGKGKGSPWKGGYNKGGYSKGGSGKGDMARVLAKEEEKEVHAQASVTTVALSLIHIGR